MQNLSEKVTPCCFINILKFSLCYKQNGSEITLGTNIQTHSGPSLREELGLLETLGEVIYRLSNNQTAFRLLPCKPSKSVSSPVFTMKCVSF